MAKPSISKDLWNEFDRLRLELLPILEEKGIDYTFTCDEYMWSRNELNKWRTERRENVKNA